MAERDGRGPRRWTPPEPAHTALVLVECQNGVLGPDPVLPALGADAGRVVDAAERLARLAREAGVLVVHATFEGSPGAVDHGRAPMMRAIALRNADWAPGHPATRPLERLLDPADLVVPRHHGLTPTWGTELLPLLRSRGITAIVFAGVSLNIAIPLSVAQSVQEGFDAIVARDAVGGTPAEFGEQVLRHMLPMLARVVPVDDLAAAWADRDVAAGHR